MIFDYLISGSWKCKGELTAFFIHQNTEKGFTTGVKTPLFHVITLLKAGHSFAAIHWDYNTRRWQVRDSIIMIEDLHGTISLVSSHNSTSLTSLIDMGSMLTDYVDAGVIQPLIRKLGATIPGPSFE